MSIRRAIIDSEDVVHRDSGSLFSCCKLLCVGFYSITVGGTPWHGICGGQRSIWGVSFLFLPCFWGKLSCFRMTPTTGFWVILVSPHSHLDLGVLLSQTWALEIKVRQTSDSCGQGFFTSCPQVSFCFLFFLSLSGSKARRVSAALCLCWYLMSLVFGCFVCLGIGSHPVAPGRPKAAVCGDGPRWWRLLMCLLFILIWSLMKYLYRSVAHLQNRAIFLLSFKSSVFYVTVFCKINVFWKLLLKVMTYLFIL